MSFSQTVKEELMRAQMKKKCCRRAFLRGLLIDAATDGEGVVTVRTKWREVADTVCVLAKEFFRCEGIVSSHVMMSELYYVVSLPIGDRLSALAQGAVCDTCPTHGLAGVFVATGTVNDPSLSYHFEFLLKNASRGGDLYTFLCDNGFAPKIVNRKSAVGIYFKNSTAIEELLTFLGAKQSLFTFINSKIERDIRNNENRATNCVAKNIAKTVNASRKSVAAIQRLIYSGRFEFLPEELYQTAKLRIDNPDMSLNELAAFHEPPISKSGLTHRLRKIEEEAEKVK